MSSPKTSEKSVYLDREEHFHRGSVGAKTVVPYYYDANTDTLTPASQPAAGGSSASYTVKITTSGTDTYIGEAAPGSSQASAVWRVQKVDADGNTTWKDGNDNFDNTATDEYGVVRYCVNDQPCEASND